MDIDNSQLQILVVDKNSHQMMPVTLSHAIKVEIVVLDGDFPQREDYSWTSEEFDNSIVKERTGKRPLLTGDLHITVREGSAVIGEIEFTDNSSWIRSRKFRLGARVVPGTNTEGLRIREAMTDAFIVKDHRGECEFINIIFLLLNLIHAYLLRFTKLTFHYTVIEIYGTCYT